MGRWGCQERPGAAGSVSGATGRLAGDGSRSEPSSGFFFFSVFVLALRAAREQLLGMSSAVVPVSPAWHSPVPASWRSADFLDVVCFCQ